MKKFLLKILLLFFVIILSSPRLIFNYFIDTYNIFHTDTIRFTEAEPNYNFIKTKYILNNKEKFNAFLFGSSRVENIPENNLLKELDECPLNWYNMTYSEGLPKENFLTLNTFVKNNVDVKFVIVTFDSICLYRSYEEHCNQLLRMSYQKFEQNPFDYYLNYLMPSIDKKLLKQVLSYSYEDNKERFNWLYKYGTGIPDLKIDFDSPIDYSRYKTFNIEYLVKDSFQDLVNIKKLCDNHNIKLILVSNPMFITNYKLSIDAGYFDFLEILSTYCDFYCFSGLSVYNTDPHYFYEYSHFKPFVGNEIAKVLFGNEQEIFESQRLAALKPEYQDLFGIKITKDNFKFLRPRLEQQLEKYKYLLIDYDF